MLKPLQHAVHLIAIFRLFTVLYGSNSSFFGMSGIDNEVNIRVMDIRLSEKNAESRSFQPGTGPEKVYLTIGRTNKFRYLSSNGWISLC